MLIPEKRDPWTWRLPAAIAAAVLVAASFVRAYVGDAAIERLWDEDRPVELAQAALLGAAMLLSVYVMVRNGPRRAEFPWWLMPAFITFFMCWRELDLDSRTLGENAFSWKYLWGGGRDLPIRNRLILGIPSLALAGTVGALLARDIRLLWRTVWRKDLRPGIATFLAGIGIYLLAQLYDKAGKLQQEHGLWLPGFEGHRDDFWEEALELAGAALIFMAVLGHFLRRPLVPGSVRPYRALLSRQARLARLEKAIGETQGQFTRARIEDEAADVLADARRLAAGVEQELRRMENAGIPPADAYTACAPDGPESSGAGAPEDRT
jgi:hypothetical protein